MRQFIVRAAFGLAFVFTISCSALEDLLKDDNCSNNQPYSGYDPADIPEPSSSSSQDDGTGVEPPNDNTSAPNTQGTVIVAPLLKSTWGRGSPYNPFGTLPDGSSGWINCSTVATAQILYYWKYPEDAFDWDNMLPSYRNVNLTETQKKEITSMLHELYLGGYDRYLGYDKSRQILYRKYYDDATWAAIIREQLDSGLVVRFHGAPTNGQNGNHAWVIDGYDNTGKFHMNWGWGGSRDGYYSLNALNPEGLDFNSSNKNYITINIKPDQGGVETYELALDTFAIEKKMVLANEQVTVVAKINPQGTFPAGQVAVALVDSRGNIAALAGVTNFKKNLSTSFTPAEMVEPGQYSLRVVAKPDGKDWETIKLSDLTKAVPKAIPITVSEFQGAKGGGWGLSLRRFNVINDKTIVSPNEEFTVDHSLSDVNSTTFPSTKSGVALMDDNNNIVEFLGTLDIPSNANSNRAVGKTIKCKVSNSVAFGQYKLRIVVKTQGNDEWRVVTQTDGNLSTIMDFTVQESSAAGGGGLGNSLAGNGVCPY